MVRRIRAASALAVLSLCTTTAAAREAHAAPTLRIEWPTVPGCPTTAVVTQHARTALAQAKEADDVLAIAEIAPPRARGEAWRLRIRTRTARGAGERTLDGASCDAIARAAGLLVALASLRTRAPATEQPLDEIVPAPDRVGEAAASAGPVHAPPAPPAERGAPPAKEAAEARFVPKAGVTLALGLLPRVGAGPSASLAYEAGWLRASVGLRALAPQAEIRAGLGAEFSSLGASGDVCARLPLGAAGGARAYACAGAVVDDLRASGRGGAQTFDVHRATALLFAGLTAEWELGGSYRLGLAARAGGAPVRPRFLVDAHGSGERELHRPAALQAETTLSFGVVF